MHVVLATRFEEPWYSISQGLQEILEEKGCTVYNLNTDNQEPRAFNLSSAQTAPNLPQQVFSLESYAGGL